MNTSALGERADPPVAVSGLAPFPAAGKLAVYIGTTAGPVRIARLFRDATNFLGIYQRIKSFDLVDYGAFVAQVINRLAGERGQCFRMDLKGEEEPHDLDGDSWQAGAFVAHALLTCDRFAAEGEAPAGVLWCTGQLDPVGDTEFVSANLLVRDKLRHPYTERMLRAFAAEGIPVRLMVPAPQQSEAVAAVGDYDWARGCVVAAASARSACKSLGIPVPVFEGGASHPKVPAAPSPVPSGGPVGRRAPRQMAAIGVAVVAALAAAGFAAVKYLPTGRASTGAAVIAEAGPVPPTVAIAASGGQAAPTTSPPVPVEIAVPVVSPPIPVSPVSVQVWEWRPPAGARCPPVQEGTLAPQVIAVTVGADGVGASRHGGSLCAVEIVVSASQSPLYAVAQFDKGSGVLADCSPVPASLTGAALFAGQARLRCNVLANVARSGSYRVIVVAGAAPVGAVRATETADELRSRGLTVIAIQHTISP